MLTQGGAVVRPMAASGGAIGRDDSACGQDSMLIAGCGVCSRVHLMLCFPFVICEFSASGVSVASNESRRPSEPHILIQVPPGAVRSSMGAVSQMRLSRSRVIARFQTTPARNRVLLIKRSFPFAGESSAGRSVNYSKQRVLPGPVR